MRLSQRTVVACSLEFASIMAIMYFAVQPVFSQAYVTFSTVTSYATYEAPIFTTTTSYLTYVITVFSSSSVITYITTLFTTSTSLLTYVSVAFSSTTTTVTYPSPSFTAAYGPIASSPTQYLTDALYASVLVWAAIRVKPVYTRVQRLFRRSL